MTTVKQEVVLQLHSFFLAVEVSYAAHVVFVSPFCQDMLFRVVAHHPHFPFSYLIAPFACIPVET